MADVDPNQVLGTVILGAVAIKLIDSDAFSSKPKKVSKSSHGPFYVSNKKDSFSFNGLKVFK